MNSKPSLVSRHDVCFSLFLVRTNFWKPKVHFTYKMFSSMKHIAQSTILKYGAGDEPSISTKSLIIYAHHVDIIDIRVTRL